MNEAHKLNRACNRQKRIQRRFKELEAIKTQQEIRAANDSTSLGIPVPLLSQIERIRERVQL